MGGSAAKTFGQDGGTIGRSLETDWPLPDPQRYLSGKHASIDFRSGTYYIVDTSRNGVFINGADEPVGRGKPQRLFEGDKLRIGEYEMAVAIANVDDTRETLMDGSHVDPVDLKQRVEEPEPTGYDLVDAHAITGVGMDFSLEEEDEADTLKPLYYKFKTGDTGETEQPTVAPAKTQSGNSQKTPTLTASTGAGPAPATKPATKPAAKPDSKPNAKTAAATTASKPTTAASAASKPTTAASAASKPAAATSAATAKTATAKPAAPASTRTTSSTANKTTGAAAVAASSNDPLAAFFRGAGIDPLPLDSKQSEQLMMQLGQVTRELLVGVIECLHLRALQKARLKQSSTTIQAMENNRLKFSANVEEGFSRLFVDDSDDYLSAVESVRGAFKDIKLHQNALMAGSRKALTDYLERLDPDTIEDRAGGAKPNALMNAANKLKYWDLYKDVFGILAGGSADEFPQVFLDELSRAYDELTTPPPKPKEAEQEAG